MIDEKVFAELTDLTADSESEKNIGEFLCSYTGRKSAVCCAGAESGLDIVLFTMGIGKGDAVFVSAIAPIFVVSSLLKAGAHIIFCDITKENPGLDHIGLEKKINDVINDGAYEPRAVILSDSFGYMPRVSEIEKICNTYGLLLIEDASEGFGGSFDGRKAGSFGDLSIVEFNKTLWNTIGNAGAILTDNEIAARFITSANGGVPTENAEGMLCYKGTCSKIHPVDGLIIESELNEFDLKREELSKRYARAAEFLKNDVVLFKSSAKYSPSCSCFPVILKNADQKEQVIEKIENSGLSVSKPFPALPVCMHPASLRFCSKASDDCTAAKRIYEKILFIL